MTLAGVKKEIRDLKKGYAPGFKPIEELLRTDPRTLTDDELFRILQHYEPGLTREDLEAKLEKMVEEEA